jgi:predicted MFS family arabinose efflux permease
MTDIPARNELEKNLERLTDRALNPRQRFGYLLLVLATAAMSAVIGSLLFTEPNLPQRTTIAFSVMLVMAIAWLLFGLRVLAVRLPLLANRDVISARMAVLFTATFTAGAVIVGQLNGMRAMTMAAWLGALMLAVAVTILIRAQRRYAALQAMRERLARP